MKIDLQSPPIRFALEVIRAGSRLARRVREAVSVRSLTKQDNSPVTLADMGIQAVTGALMEQYFPQEALVAEERADVLRNPEGQADRDKVTELVRAFFPQAMPGEVCDWIDRGKAAAGRTFWTLDPIDGTKGFLRGGQYAVALALICDGKPEIAVLGCPNLEVPEELGKHRGLLVLAARGKGCWGAALDGDDRWTALRVSDRKDMTRARILESVESGHRNTEKKGSLRERMGILPEPIPLDSQAKHAVLAMGGAEIFYRTLPVHNPGWREKIWDVAPGALVIEEAGGRVTDLEGKPIDYGCGITLLKNPGFVATNGLLHEKVLEALAKGAA